MATMTIEQAAQYYRENTSAIHAAMHNGNIYATQIVGRHAQYKAAQVSREMLQIRADLLIEAVTLYRVQTGA